MLGRQVCVPPVLVRVDHPAGIAPAFLVGQLWCTSVNMRPGPALGTILSFIDAGRWCGKGDRGWAYAKVVT